MVLEYGTLLFESGFEVQYFLRLVPFLHRFSYRLAYGILCLQ